MRPGRSLGPHGAEWPIHGERLPKSMARRQLDRRGPVTLLDARTESFGVGENQGFPLPAEPEVLMETPAVEIGPELAHHLAGIPEGTEKGDLRYRVPLSLHPVKHAAERLPVLRICDLIGHVEDDHIDAGVSE